QIFRLFNTALWVLLSIAMVPVIRGRISAPDDFVIISWAQTTFLLVYLWWDWLRRRLGAAYLPIALVVASLVPVIGQGIAVAIRMRQGLEGSAPLVDSARLYFWLLLPLILISSQYGMRAVLSFTTGTTLLSILIARALAVRGGPDIA